jgi:transcription elongation factor Elf1
MAFEPGDDDEAGEGSKAARRRRFREFDCPECSANNPCDDGFGHGETVLCNYCGEELQVAVDDDGRLRLRVT